MSRARIVASVALAALLAAGLTTAVPSKASAAPAGIQPTTTTTTRQYSVPCPPPSTQTCTITTTFTVTKTVRFVGTKNSSTSGSSPYSTIGGGGGCTSGSATTNNTYRYTALGLWYWTVTMQWNFNWSDCSPVYVNTTYYDYSCTANSLINTSCNSISNTGVSGMFWCNSITQSRLAHADFYGTYLGGYTWSAYLRTQGWDDGEVYKPNTINP
jgi:hypothetical protein